MIIDSLMSFANGQSLSGTTDQASTNVFDAGTAKKLFAGAHSPKMAVLVSAVGGTTPTFRARIVAADDAALTTNPEILADTGVTKALAAADLPLAFDLMPLQQKAAKRYYGVMFTQSGTAPTATASANLVMDSQSQLLK